jgi:hypothetical protein
MVKPGELKAQQYKIPFTFNVKDIAVLPFKSGASSMRKKRTS